MVENPDMVLGIMDGKEIIKPNWYKVFLVKDSKIIQHKCLYEGKVAYEKLDNHLIIGQITVEGDTHTGDKHNGIEITPFTNTHFLQKNRIMLPNDKRIWRFMSLFKFEDLINSNTLYFARLDQFEDKLEGISPESCVEIIKSEEKVEREREENLILYKRRMDNNRKISYACCWHINDKINFDLWNEYGLESTDSIAIQTNFKKINEVLKKSNLQVLNEPIRYFKEPYFSQSAYWFPTLFKRIEYENEQELRSILFVHGLDTLSGLRINIKPEQLISKIYVHPNASNEYFKKIRLFIKNKGLKIPVRKHKI